MTSLPWNLNPVDDGSRVLKSDATTPIYIYRWLNGPAFVLLSEDQWLEGIPKSKFAPDATFKITS